MNADVYGPEDYVQAGRRIDPKGEDLPAERVQEIKTRQATFHAIWDESRAQREMSSRQKGKLRETRELREEEAEALRDEDELPAAVMRRQRT
jgi:hypothetical protein